SLALLPRTVFAARLPVLCSEGQSATSAEQSAICRRQSVSPDNRPATQVGPLVPCSSRTRPGFESDHRNADPTRTGSSLLWPEWFSHAQRGPATPAVVRPLSFPCSKGGARLFPTNRGCRVRLPLSAQS